MNFSVEKATSMKKRENKNLRNIMIEKENLHIEDLISHDEFLRLYNSYGNGLTEKEFADIFLDIKDTDFYGFKEGTNRLILKKEEMDDVEIALMKLHIIKKFNLKKEEGKFYNEIEEIYNSIPTKLNIITFAEKVLDVLRDELSKIKYDQTERRKTFSKTDDIYFSEKSETEIEGYINKTVTEKKNELVELKDTIAMDMNLHMGDELERDKFLELYEIYGEDNFSQFDFAKEVLGLTESRAKKLIDGKIKDAKVWEHEILDLDYLLKIRENTIFDENLHIKDQISYKKFKEIYKKHSRILSENDFATEILDITKSRFYGFKKEKYECMILSDIEVPQEFYPEIKKQVQENEDVYFGKSITYEEFCRLYEKYGFITNELEFAEEVLEIAKKGFTEFQDGTIKTKNIFLKSKKLNKGKDTKNYNPKQIEKLREIVIKENKLHIEDSITGRQFVNIYNKYGSGMSQKSFAVKILDIDERRLDDIIRDYEKRKGKDIADNEEKAVILRNEKVSDKEIKHMRKIIFKVGEHSKDDLINYEEFKRLHTLYGGKLSENQFAKKIVFISDENLSLIRNGIDTDRKTAIFSNLKISDEYIANLKAQVIRKNLLFFRQRITPKFLTKLYEEAVTIFSKPKFAEKILEVNRQNYYDSVDSGRHDSCEILSVSGSMENREKFFKKRDKTIVQMLRDGASYNDIEEDVNITHRDLLKKTDSLFENELDKDEIVRKHVYFSILTGGEIDSELVGDIKVQELEKIKKEVEADKKFFALENKCIKILEEFLERKNDRKHIMNYIKKCKERYYGKLYKMPKKTLVFLQEALEYAEYDRVNLDDCLFFSKACIEHREYKRANSYITFNMQNDNIMTSEKKKLQELREAVREASRRTDEIESRKQKKKERIIA